MIKSISLIGFKSFLHRELNLNKLTLLTGLNSSGKSSVIQALRILEKAAISTNDVLLEGYGSANEIKNNYYKDDIELKVKDETNNGFEVKIPLEYTYGVKTLYTNFIGPSLGIPLQQLSFPEIIYISANRFGPRTSLPIYTDSLKRNRIIGENGENLFQCITQLAEYVLNEKLRHENSQGETLGYNIQGWLNAISPNVVFKPYVTGVTDSSYSTFDEHRAANVGFGLSYALPVITALLVGTITPNCLVIIENPEAHLHPRGQTEIARLIALCAQVGAQIIVETHSDHLLDGIRIAAKNNQGFAEQVQIHWFELDKEKNTEVYSPTLYDDGRIDEWPKGFFDQFEINASKLL